MNRINIKVEYRKYMRDTQHEYSHDFRNRDIYKSSITNKAEVDVFNKKILIGTLAYNYAIDFPSRKIKEAREVVETINSYLDSEYPEECSVEIVMEFILNNLKETVFKLKSPTEEKEIAFNYQHFLNTKDTDEDKKEIFVSTLKEKIEVMDKANKVDISLIDDLMAYLVKIRFDVLEAEKKS